MRNRRTGILIIALLGAVTAAYASSARVWVVEGGEQVMRGTLDGVSVRADGEPGPRTRGGVSFRAGALARRGAPAEAVAE